MTTLKVTMIDDRPAVFLPPELAERLGVNQEGSEIVFDEGVLRPADAEPSPALAAMREVMVRRRDVLRRLAE